MNYKGFAVTTMVYAAILLFSLVMFSVLGVEKNRYVDQRDYIEDINEELSSCLAGGKC